MFLLHARGRDLKVAGVKPNCFMVQVRFETKMNHQFVLSLPEEGFYGQQGTSEKEQDPVEPD